MAGVYPELEALVVVDASGPKDRLNAEVWRHARLAEQRGLALVVEVHARSVLASRRLTEWWKSGNVLMQDTLSGTYLLRIDLQTFGPEAVIKLTPYAVVGVPLFVGWNPIGQVCGRSQFEELTPESMALPLSAFVEDVLAGRPHSLNPVPSLGSAERTREAVALRRVGQAFGKAMPRRLGETLAVGGGSPEQPVADSVAEPSSVGDDASVPDVVQSEAVPADFTQSSAPLEEARDEQTDVAESANAPPELSKLGDIVAPLDQLLAAARSKFGALEDRVGAPLRLQVDDLRAVDQWQEVLTDEERLAFAREFGAVLAIYVGDTIIRRVRADWVWESNNPSGAAKLTLVGEVLGEERRTEPFEWVVATLSDEARSLYGQALAWCRVV
jgi:hypothetical protein